jgi:hypothetical protein
MFEILASQHERYSAGAPESTRESYRNAVSIFSLWIVDYGMTNLNNHGRLNDRWTNWIAEATSSKQKTYANRKKGKHINIKK